MLVLINKQRVMAEALELSRMKIAGILRIPLMSIQAQWETNTSGQVVPNFIVEFPETPGITKSQVRQVIKSVYDNLRNELRERLTGLKSQRPERRKELFGREIMS
jgi:hypothetical protein